MISCSEQDVEDSSEVMKEAKVLHEHDHDDLESRSIANLLHQVKMKESILISLLIGNYWT